jgi:hypothetical protein
MERNVLADIDWVQVRAAFLMVLALLMMPLLVVASEKLYARFGAGIDGFILRALKRFDERRARKAR